MLSKYENEYLVDSYNRRIDYLRVSLTDACNFRCVYCVSPGSTKKIQPNTSLARDEILRFVGLAASSGIRRIRLTGGEPLLRADIIELIATKLIVKVSDYDGCALCVAACRTVNDLVAIKMVSVEGGEYHV